MKKLKVYIAGKVSPQSVFGRHDWRDEFCEQLSKVLELEIINIDPTQSSAGFELDENNSKLIFGRDCYMIHMADVVIVHLTDDISVGGSQEMLIAKFYKKPLIGIAPKGGKFYKGEKEILGKVYKDWIHPFVTVPCDAVVQDIDLAARYIKDMILEKSSDIKTIDVINESLEYYRDEYLQRDSYIQGLDQG